tara:strand:+ start:14883 stop:15503 length:621 start_codon:yes stop_codon:yes gene_type:complete
MTRVLVSRAGESRERWREAFPAEPIVQNVEAVDARGLQSLWLDISTVKPTARGALVHNALGAGCPVVAMVAIPSEADALSLLQLGIRGYCHVQAAPPQMREIAVVIEHGGLWMPPELMQRFVTASSRLVPGSAPRALELNALTSRELMVAEQVGRGASNREIAEVLKISERTVKAHLTAIFEKLEVRDRVQLALAMNHIPTYSTVN